MIASSTARAACVVVAVAGSIAAAANVPARAQDRPSSAPGASAVGSATPALRNPNLERTQKVVEEVIGKLRKLHRYGDALAPERCRESAIVALRDYVSSKSFHFLDGEARNRFRRALWSFPEGNLDACIAVIDSHLGPRSAEDTWTITDVLARGAIKATDDPYTQLLDRQTYDLLDLAMLGERPKSFGLRASERDGLLVVDHVFHGYDAVEKGLRKDDVLVEVDGRPPLQLGMDEVQRRLGGDDGTLRLRVFRKDFATGHDVELEARAPRDPNVVCEILPGGVGYLRIESFLARTPEDVELALGTLESHKATSLILDLRDNPGGAIASVQGVAHLFLDGERVICTTAQASGAAIGLSAVPKEIRCGEGPPRTRLPLYVLVNQDTASASELLAAALQNLTLQGETRPRATIVGTRTYGKHVGQAAVPLASAARERFLLVTTMSYVAPGAHDEKNPGIPVVPDCEVAPFAYTPAEEEEIFSLHASRAFENYLAVHAAPDGQVLAGLAKEDEGKFDSWPGFAAWARGLGVNLTLGTLRRALRCEVRGWAARQRGLLFRADLRDDFQIHRAYELAVEAEAARSALPPSPPPTEPKPPGPAPSPPAKRYF